MAAPELLDLPDEILVLVAARLDLAALAALARTCRRLGAIAALNDVWVPHYRGLTHPEGRIGPGSVHEGPVTYRRCARAHIPYPGLEHLDDPVPNPGNAVCRNRAHYRDLEQPELRARFRDFRFQVGKRRRRELLERPENKFTPADQRGEWRAVMTIARQLRFLDGLEEKRARVRRIEAAFAPIREREERSRRRRSRKDGDD
eukprot:tig00000492_g1535.t1